MAKYKLFTDSNVDLPKELLEKLNVSILPMNIVMDDVNYLDIVDITPDDILEYGERTKKTPKTASPTLEAAINVLKEMEDYDYGIFFMISSKVSSSTYMIVNNAIQYMNLEDRVVAIDTKSLSGGTGQLILKAQELIDNNLDFPQIVATLKEDVKRLHTGFVIDSLDYLYYGGRCSQMSVLFTGTLKIKPCVNLVDGEMKVVKKYRGNLVKVMDKYVNDMAKDLDKIEDRRIIITHTRMDDEALTHVIRKVEDLHYFGEIIVADASATITSHGGPNTLGLFYFIKQL